MSGAPKPAAKAEAAHAASASAADAPAPASKLAVILAKLKSRLPKRKIAAPAAPRLNGLERLLVVAVSSVMSLALIVLCGTGYVAFRLLHPPAPPVVAHHAPEGEEAEGEGGEEAHESAHAEGGEHGSEHGAEHGGGEDSSSIVAEAEILPKEILERQDGKIDPDQDLVEPDIQKTRGIASLLKEDFKGEGPPKYVEIAEIVAGTRGGEKGDGVVLSDLVLVVTSHETITEVEARMTEFKALVSTLVADRSQDELRTFAGKAALKLDIQREVNHLLGKGQVKDVLFSKFLVR